ncbi:MAG: RIO1 family regulatory kinase/ATPase domain-containing protein, partial [bacterium]
IHGDLSEFNVLMGADGPVVIDFPQSVDAARNPSARKLLLRDVENLERFLSRFAPGDRIQPFAEEMWALYETNRLEPDTQLTGSYRRPTGPVHTDEVLALIEDAGRDERRRRDPRGRDPQGEDALAEGPPPLRRVVEFGTEARGRSGSDRSRRRAATRGPRSDRREESGSRPAAEAAAPAADRGAEARPGRRGRRRRPRGSEKPGSGSDTAARAGGPQARRGPREPQGEAKGAQAKGRPDPGRDSRGAEERAPAEGPARSRRARRSRRKASQSPTEEQAGRAPRPPTRSTTERERSERSDTPRNGSDPSRRGRGRQRRSDSRST